MYIQQLKNGKSSDIFKFVDWLLIEIEQEHGRNNYF